MNKRLLSHLLFALFCVVIAFPGYGSNNTMHKNEGQATFSAAVDDSWGAILINCLSSGINMIEEERTSEEDDQHSGLHYVFGESVIIHHQTQVESLLFSWTSLSESVYFKGVFAPPEWL